MKRLSLVAAAAILVLAACTPAPPGAPDEGALTGGAIDAFQRHVEQLGRGRLVCSREAVRAAQRVSGDINEDGIVDHVIDTQTLDCSTQDHTAAVSYFCGLRICAYPAIISDGDGWRVIPMMAGNSIEFVAHYHDARVLVRQLNYADPSGDTILVREYAWRDGDLARVAVREETARGS